MNLHPLTAEQQKQVAENYNLIKFYCGRKKLNFEEYSGDLSIALIQAVQTYPQNADFTLTTHIMRNFGFCVGEIKRAKNRLKRTADIVPFSDLEINQPHYLDDYSSVYILSELEKRLNKEEYEIFYLWCFENRTYKEIAEIKGNTSQAVHKRIKKINGKLQHFFQKTS